MPEITEVRIMSDFINQNSENRFIKAWHVEKGNNPKPFEWEHHFNVQADSKGKELLLNFYNRIGEELKIWVFMGMNGNWKYVPTDEWNQTKFVRMRLDDESGNSLLLYGGFMGPKYSVGKPFNGTKRGPDPTKQFDKFKSNVLDNLDKKVFDNPICEVLLNQEYFSGIGNYLRSTIIHYGNVNPFDSGRKSLSENPHILDLCRDIPLKSYQLNGGQLRDWSNPFDNDSKEFEEWVYYQKGLSCKDKGGRTFWFEEKWKDSCPYKINQKKSGKSKV
jgi:formamidopyrimidine-DNA glycosylase